MQVDMRHKRLKIKMYEGAASVVKELSDLVIKGYEDLFIAVIVHGSIGTNDVVAYSDFDGLLIVKDRYKDSKMLRSFLNKSMLIIRNFDPMQHHGWFIIYENDLSSYPINYLPVESLNKSKLVYPHNDLFELNIIIKESFYTKRLIESILDGLERKLRENWSPRNKYQLKAYLSQIMLLPCLYGTIRDQAGLFKGDSFELVRKDFTEVEWSPIAYATILRNEWNSEMTTLEELFLRSRIPIVRELSKKYGGPYLSNYEHKILKNYIVSNMESLIKAIKMRLSIE